MGKKAPDEEYDNGLSYIDGGNYECVCSAEPADYNAAYVTLMLAKVAMAAGDITISAAVSGRKATMAQKLAVPITNPGTATHIAVVDTGTSTLRFVTICDSLVLAGGGTVDIPSWSNNIQAPI